jgi:hypothetical protein
MADSEQEAIAPEFAQWYGLVEIGRDEERRKLRWSGILALRADQDPPLIEGLVRLAFGSRHAPSAEIKDRIVEAFRDADATYAADVRELQVLAASALWRGMQDDDNDGAVAAMSILSASFCDQRSAELPMDLVGLARVRSGEMAENMRKRPSLDKATKAYSLETPLEKPLEKLLSDFNAPSVKTAFDAVKTGYGSLSRIYAEGMKQLVSYVKVQDEELQMLWWLISGWSRLADAALDGVAADAQPLLFAAELAGMTEMVPGPQGIEGLLTKAGMKGRRKITVGSMIKACNAPWLASLVPKDEVSPLTLPLHHALRRNEEAGRKDKWVSGWAATADVAEEATFAPLALAQQFYRERLLLMTSG